MTTTTRRLLIAFAHPDDESFGLGAFIGRAVSDGIEVYYVCATNGDVGTVSPELMNGYQSVKELRLAELECAAQLLKFKEVLLLGYKDSGMMGAAENQDPECLWYHWSHRPAEVTRRMVETIRTVQPQVVITFNRYGGYGHPDHIAIQAATTEAFSLAADAGYMTPGLAPYAPQKLYYNTFPTFFFRVAVTIMRLRGKNPRKAGRNQDIDLLKIFDYIEPSHARVDVSAYLDLWDQASACHVSQGGGRAGFTPRWLRKMFGYQQGFTRIVPVPGHNRVDERDLFAGIGLDERVTEGA